MEDFDRPSRHFQIVLLGRDGHVVQRCSPSTGEILRGSFAHSVIVAAQLLHPAMDGAGEGTVAAVPAAGGLFSEVLPTVCTSPAGREATFAGGSAVFAGSAPWRGRHTTRMQ